MNPTEKELRMLLMGIVAQNGPQHVRQGTLLGMDQRDELVVLREPFLGGVSVGLLRYRKDLTKPAPWWVRLFRPGARSETARA
jgi:hypothetical protein